MFPIRITTLLTEEIYERFSWAILIRRKSFIIYITIILGLLLYLMIMITEKQDIIFIVLFAILVLLPIAFLALMFRIKRSYRKKHTWWIPLYLWWYCQGYCDKERFLYLDWREYWLSYWKKELHYRGSWLLAKTADWTHVKKQARLTIDQF